MKPFEIATSRLRSVIDETDRLLESDFPYPHSEQALLKIRETLNERLIRINGFSASSDPDTVQQGCAEALTAIFKCLPLLGFILRSTNVRNAFEVFGPLLRLASCVLEPKTQPSKRTTKLVLSSEWGYSPSVYPELSSLSGFVLLGLPASESANPLLLPLTGHELGHPAWERKNLKNKFQKSITSAVVNAIKSRWAEYIKIFPGDEIKPEDLETNLLVVETWRQADEWALLQAEESFCDFLGIRLFGASYLHAFAYLLSPSTLYARSAEYPNTLTRVRNHTIAAKAYKASIPTDYEKYFIDRSTAHLTDADLFRLKIADAALNDVIKTLIDEADKIAANAGICPEDTGPEIDKILSQFKKVVPAEDVSCLANILIAAWRAHEDASLWIDRPNVCKDKESILKELVLKNIEVFEIEQIRKEAASS